MDFSGPEELFTDEYAYFSSTSTTWVKHASEYVSNVIDRFQLDSSSHVIEIASNDGYLLQFFLEKGIPCTGIEPTHSTASAARQKGINTIEKFFGVALAEILSTSIQRPELVIANNVLAHVPDINDFVAGLSALVSPTGVITIEFPHVQKLINENQFDTIYHEHFSYFSLTSVTKVMAFHNLKIFDLESISTHGGSLRIFVCKNEADYPVTPVVEEVISSERADGLDCRRGYDKMQESAFSTKMEFIKQVLDARLNGRRIIGLGAAAKGNTLLNYCGLKSDVITCVIDSALSKQDKFLPGSHVPIISLENFEIRDDDLLVVFPWNIASELKSMIEAHAGKSLDLYTAIPCWRKV
jgi:hypothetical protein